MEGVGKREEAEVALRRLVALSAFMHSWLPALFKFMLSS
jgi:hypothetical protein